jgi:hypothetical protein
MIISEKSEKEEERQVNFPCGISSQFRHPILILNLVLSGVRSAKKVLARNWVYYALSICKFVMDVIVA